MMENRAVRVLMCVLIGFILGVFRSEIAAFMCDTFAPWCRDSLFPTMMALGRAMKDSIG